MRRMHRMHANSLSVRRTPTAEPGLPIGDTSIPAEGSRKSAGVWGDMTAWGLAEWYALLLGGQRRAEAGDYTLSDCLGGLGHGLSQLLHPAEHMAATGLAACYRAHAARSAYRRQRRAALLFQDCTRARRARRVFAAAVVLQKWMRGFIDRQWVRLLAEEIALLNDARLPGEPVHWHGWRNLRFSGTGWLA